MSMNPGAAFLGRLARSMFKVVLDRLNDIDSRMDKMTQATDNLNAKIDELGTAIGEAVDQIEAELATIKSVPAAPTSTATPEDSAAINNSADRISTLTATIRSAINTAKSELAAASAAPTSGTSTSDTVTGGGTDTVAGSTGDTVTGASGNSTIVDGGAPVSSAPASAPSFGDTPAGGA